LIRFHTLERSSTPIAVLDGDTLPAGSEPIWLRRHPLHLGGGSRCGRLCRQCQRHRAVDGSSQTRDLGHAVDANRCGKHFAAALRIHSVLTAASHHPRDCPSVGRPCDVDLVSPLARRDPAGAMTYSIAGTLGNATRADGDSTRLPSLECQKTNRHPVRTNVSSTPRYRLSKWRGDGKIVPARCISLGVRALENVFLETTILMILRKARYSGVCHTAPLRRAQFSSNGFPSVDSAAS